MKALIFTISPNSTTVTVELVDNSHAIGYPEKAVNVDGYDINGRLFVTKVILTLPDECELPKIPVKKPREILYENTVTRSYFLPATCNACERIIYADEMTSTAYAKGGGYCPQCREAIDEVEPDKTTQKQYNEKSLIFQING